MTPEVRAKLTDNTASTCAWLGGLLFVLTGVLLFLEIRSATEAGPFTGVAIYAALTALGPSFVASVVLLATSSLLRALARILRTLGDTDRLIGDADP